MTDSTLRGTVRFLTNNPPAPGISGDRIRVFHLMRELRDRGWRVRTWSLVGPGEPAGFEEALRAVSDEVVLVPAWPSRAQRMARLARDLATRRAFQAGWFWSAAAARQAATWLDDGNRDPIFVEQLFMYPYVPPALRYRVSLDTQNHEGSRVRAMAAGGGGRGRRWVAKAQIGAVDRYEASALRAVGNVLAVSEDEAQRFEVAAPGRVHLVPNGVDVRAIVPLAQPTASRDLLFLGSLGYGANADAVEYFVGDIAPSLAASGLRLTVVGGGASEALQRVVTDAAIPVDMAGFVPDLAPVFRSARMLVVPLRHGGGTRLKILEALAWGLPVVATTLGAAGLELRNGEQALLADDPAGIARAIERLSTDDGLWMHLSAHGRRHVEERFSWSRIGDAIDVAITELVDASPRRP